MPRKTGMKVRGNVTAMTGLSKVRRQANDFGAHNCPTELKPKEQKNRNRNRNRNNFCEKGKKESFPPNANFASTVIMAVNSSTHWSPMMKRPLPPCLPLSFLNWISSRPLFSPKTPNLRLGSVRAEIPASDGYGYNKSLNLTDSKAMIGSSSSSTSSAIDFLTLCNSLVVEMIMQALEYEIEHGNVNEFFLSNTDRNREELGS